MDWIVSSELANDQFDIGYRIYADANQDGVADDNIAITTTPSLQPGQKFNFVVVGAVPSTGVNSGDFANITVTATSAFDGGQTDTNADSVTVSNNAVVALTKSVDKSSGTAASNPFTYTLRYVNNSNVAASTVAISDPLAAGLNYVDGSGRWNTSGTTPLADTNGVADDPTGIN